MKFFEKNFKKMPKRQKYLNINEKLKLLRIAWQLFIKYHNFHQSSKQDRKISKTEVTLTKKAKVSFFSFDLQFYMTMPLRGR